MNISIAVRKHNWEPIQGERIDYNSVRPFRCPYPYWNPQLSDMPRVKRKTKARTVASRSVNYASDMWYLH